MSETNKEAARPESLPLCDVVMQGGVTSGVVYPKAAVALAREFRLKNIGGTSVGALAAAVTAAAELGRLKDPANPGYKRLERLTKELIGEDPPTSGATRLFKLFQPQRGTRALFGILTASLNHKSKSQRALSILLAAIRCYGLPFFGTAAVLLVIQAFAGQGGWWNWLIATVLALLSGCVAVAIGLWKTATGPFVANGFGMCTGYLVDLTAQLPVGDPREPLTLWLSRMINQNAGNRADGPPLTFGELWEPGLDGARPPEWLRQAGVETWRYIDLQMISTNVTHCRPYRFPIEDEDQELFFKEDELKDWFPPNVIQHLVAKAGKYEPGPDTRKPPLPAGMYKLPSAADLPVVFAARLSLSFPFLLSAVPLYAIDYDCQQYALRTFERCWFSDGGITSNFPIHFFDSPLPLWPTFGIALEDERKFQKIREHPVDLTQRDIVPSDLDRANRFFLPPNNEAGRGDTFLRFNEGKSGGARLFGFVDAILESARYWPDYMLTRAPAVRDRVVRVYLKADEGGLNLNMPAAALQTLAASGEEAAAMLSARFRPGSPDPMNFDNHRWVRLRSLTRVLEADVSSVDQATLAYRGPDLVRIGALIDTNGAKPGREWYGATPPQRAKIHELLERLQATSVTAQSGGDLLRPNAPRRAPVLRIVPDV